MSAAPVLPRAALERSPVDELALRSLHLATIVRAVSRRRDVAELRARILLLVMQFACPLHRSPAKPWYVPGAVARFGAAGIVRTWRTFFGVDAPSERRIRAHLSVLERAAALVRAPGDLLPTLAPAEGPRPRYPDTLHLVLDELESAWWASEGRERLAREPLARHSGVEWRRKFGAWRAEAHDPQLHLPFELGLADPSRDPRERELREARQMALKLRAAAGHENVLDRLSATVGAGVALHGRVASELARAPDALSASLLALSRELLRGRRVRNPAGWLIWAFRFGPGWLG